MMLKLGPHHAQGGSETGKWLALIPAVAKFVGDLGAGFDARPGTLTIGREVDDGAFWGQGFDMNRFLRDGKTPEYMADQYTQFLRDKIRLNQWIQVWEPANEQVFIADDRENTNPVLAEQLSLQRQQAMAWYGAFSYAFAERMSLLGKQAGLGAWSAGNPLKEHDLWRYWTRALDAVKLHRAILTRHEYGGLEPDGTLRIDYDNWQFASLGYPDMPVVISEFGMDSVSWIPESGAWKNYYGSMDRYWTELLHPCLDAFSTRSYCLGATLFSDGGPGWPNYDISGTDIVERLRAYAPPQGETFMDEIKRQQSIAALQDAAKANTAVSNSIQTALTLLQAAVPAPAPTPPQPLYRAVVLYNCTLRDKDANTINHPTLAPNGVVQAGTQVDVYEEFDISAVYIHRAALSLEASKPNICYTTQAKGPSLRRL